MLGRCAQVAVWEWRQQVRQWSFLLSTWLPVVIGLVLVWVWRQGEHRQPAPSVVAVWDETGQWLRRLSMLADSLGGAVVPYPLTREEASHWNSVLERVGKDWSAVVRLQVDTAGLVASVWGFPGALSAVRALLAAVEGELRARTLARLPLSESVRQSIQYPLIVEEYPLSRRTSGEPQLVSLLGVLVLSSALVWGARTVTEERYGHISEFLLSFVSAHEFVVGKFLGAAGIGVVPVVGLVLVWGLSGMMSGEQLWEGLGALLLGYAFWSALGLWLAVRARNEAQLHGTLTLALGVLFTAPGFLVWLGDAVAPALLVVPAWMPVAVLWASPSVGAWVLGAVLSAVAITALVRSAARSVQWLWSPPVLEEQ